MPIVELHKTIGVNWGMRVFSRVIAKFGESHTYISVYISRSQIALR